MSIIASSSSSWFANPLLLALIPVVGSIITAVLTNRAAAKRDRLARAAQRQSRFAGNLFAAVLLLIGGGLIYRAATDATTNRTVVDSAGPVESTTSLPPSSVAPTVAPTASATCPSQAEFAAAASFSNVPSPPDDSRMVLQFIARQATHERQFVVSICRDSSAGYWYFSRYRDDETQGVITNASRTDEGFVAVNGAVVYRFSAAAGSAKGGGFDLVFVLDDIVCADVDDVQQAFVDAAPTPCTEDLIDAWTPQS